LYGASTPGVRNASMGFEEETLEPTYVLKLGAPGKSAGLDIALRLGLDPALIEAARGRMSSLDRELSRLLGELNHRLEALERERAAVQQRASALDQREHSIERDWERKYAAKIREIDRRASELSADFEQRVRETIGDLSQKARAKVAKTKREYHEAVESLAPAPAPKDAAPTLKLQEGARVRLKGIRQPATVRKLLQGDLLEVDAGFLKMQVSSSDIEEVLPASNAGTARPSIEFHQGPRFDASFREINVIGQRAEAAIDQVDKMLDSAALAQVERVRIVHGHGMGILRRAIADLLKENPHVEKFYAAPQEEGGSGATIVELK
ncbi:MAG: Smr/MutS family protein, partial [Bryobacteraceae bacterium]